MSVEQFVMLPHRDQAEVYPSPHPLDDDDSVAVAGKLVTVRREHGMTGA